MIDTAKLKLDMDIENGRASKIRDGIQKLCIRGDMDGEFRIEMWAKVGTANGIELKWMGHLDRVDMRIKNKDFWVYDYSVLRKKEIRQLIEWLVRVERQLL